MPSSRKTTRTKQRPSTLPLIGAAVAALILSFGMLFGLQYIGTQQDVQNQASTIAPVKLRVHGQTVTGGELRIDLLLNSNSHAVAGTQFAAKITGANANEVSLNLSNSLGLETVGSKVSSQADGAYVEFTQFAPLDKNRPVTTNGQESKIGSITIKRSQGGTFTMTVNNSTSIPVVGNPNVPFDFTRTQTFTLAAAGTSTPTASPIPGVDNRKGCNMNCATDPECKSGFVCYKNQCRLNSNKEDTKCGDVGDQGIHRSCNQYCADKNECGPGMSCYYNRCRNPRNLTNESCTNPASPRPVVYATTVPTKGSTASPSPSVSPTASVSASTSPSPSPSASSNIYDEDAFRVSPSPIVKRTSPTPSPAARANATGSNRFLRAGLILLFALGIVIPVGIYFYRRAR
jgi:hypothetical protein